MKNFNKIFVLLFAFALSISVEANYNVMYSGNNYEQAKSDSSKMNHKHMKQEAKTAAKKNPIVREGVIDVASIDKNKDGKVYQDMMCWNVISDEAGDSPLAT